MGEFLSETTPRVSISWEKSKVQAAILIFISGSSPGGGAASFFYPAVTQSVLGWVAAHFAAKEAIKKGNL